MQEANISLLVYRRWSELLVVFRGQSNIITDEMKRNAKTKAMKVSPMQPYIKRLKQWDKQTNKQTERRI